MLQLRPDPAKYINKYLKNLNMNRVLRPLPKTEHRGLKQARKTESSCVTSYRRQKSLGKARVIMSQSGRTSGE